MSLATRRHREDNIENFVRKNTRMIVQHSAEKPTTTGYNNGLYKCKDCDKEYRSFQALGGHRASHRAPRPDTTTGLESNSKPKLHRCKICNKGFEIGQALGGHMRKHWKKKNKVNDILPVDSNSCSTSSSLSILNHSNGDQKVFKYDLNLTPHENQWINEEQLDQDFSLAAT
ncbi:hypothetical protein E3N88_06300 [Mikania micrantha]|uniref:C2H2-type domain-containing protein n=1 Tax=Mikania micrantha TaxID=192012 RepID=A0A5N6PND0_9ASTR|nr:hypothetical protein E3N88_06300 [Mikania micrantha]